MSALPVTVLVVAKAPQPGLAKTRLARTVGPQVAAEIAAAALLDTLDAVAAAAVTARVVALSGDVAAAAGADEIRRRLESFTVLEQRGDGFAERLVNAHADASSGHPVLQIGMDTPQVTAGLLTGCAQVLLEAPALLGPACDGGWWALGVRTPAMAECLRDIPMSRLDTGERTLKALHDNGIDVSPVERLADIDVLEDVAVVREACRPESRFARVSRAAGL